MKSVSFMMKMSEGEMELLESLSEHNMMSKSAYMRRLLHGLERRPVASQEIDVDGIPIISIDGEYVEPEQIKPITPKPASKPINALDKAKQDVAKIPKKKEWVPRDLSKSASSAGKAGR